MIKNSASHRKIPSGAICHSERAAPVTGKRTVGNMKSNENSKLALEPPLPNSPNRHSMLFSSG